MSLRIPRYLASYPDLLTTVDLARGPDGRQVWVIDAYDDDGRRTHDTACGRKCLLVDCEYLFLHIGIIISRAALSCASGPWPVSLIVR